MRFSPVVVEHFQDPRNMGELTDASHIGYANWSGQPPHVVLALRIADDHVQAARFQTVGCGAMIASCSVLTEMIQGCSVVQCEGLSVANLLERLGGLPRDKEHCALIAFHALQNALTKFRANASPSPGIPAS